MKLYNNYKELILETIATRQLIVEQDYVKAAQEAIDNKYNVNIEYKDYEDQPPSKRYIQVYNFSQTTAGNDCIRAFQIFGGSKTTPKEGAWKIFRLDRIVSWNPTKVKWKRPVSDLDPNIPTYNKTGDRTMARVNKKVKF